MAPVSRILTHASASLQRLDREAGIIESQRTRQRKCVVWCIYKNMKLRCGGQQQPALPMDTSMGADKGKVSSSATDTTVGAKPVHHHLDAI